MFVCLITRWTKLSCRVPSAASDGCVFPTHSNQRDRVLVCHHGNLTISVGVRANLQLAVILLIIVQARSVAGQDPAIQNRFVSQSISTKSDSVSAGQAASLPHLVFDETRIDDAREGHATLTWTALAKASSYRVSNADGNILYRGAFPQAFVSGLEDGEHRFTVAALDAAGQTLAISPTPAVVMVRHWPLAQALLLLAVGGLVFIALVVVLAYGAIACHIVDDRVTHRLTGQAADHRGDSQP